MVYTGDMLTYQQLKDQPRDFLAATGLLVAEFVRLLPAYQTAYGRRYPRHLTLAGKERQRQPGGGSKGVLDQAEDRLVFILIYLKTNPWQTMHGLQFGLSQSQTNYWIHHLLPVVQAALHKLGLTPERDGSQVATSRLALEGTPDLALNGTERHRKRPQDADEQRAHYSGKKKTHTDKNIVLVNEHLRAVIFDTKNHVLKIHTVYVGSLNTAVVRVGELFREALRLNAATVIIAHNHPSGAPPRTYTSRARSWTRASCSTSTSLPPGHLPGAVGQLEGTGVGILTQI